LLGKLSIACLFLTVPLIGKKTSLGERGHGSNSKHEEKFEEKFATPGR
jgi:hypothetical protein